MARLKAEGLDIYLCGGENYWTIWKNPDGTVDIVYYGERGVIVSERCGVDEEEGCELLYRSIVAQKALYEQHETWRKQHQAPADKIAKPAASARPSDPASGPGKGRGSGLSQRRDLAGTVVGIAFALLLAALYHLNRAISRKLGLSPWILPGLLLAVLAGLVVRLIRRGRARRSNRSRQ